MADLRVARKGPKIWPWVFGLLVLALVVWLLVELWRNDDKVIQQPVTMSTADHSGGVHGGGPGSGRARNVCVRPPVEG